MVRTPELAAEVTVQPVELIGVDAAIIFSDILVVPEAMITVKPSSFPGSGMNSERCALYSG